MVLTKFRDTMRRISPRWLNNGLAEKIQFSWAVHLDLLGDSAVEGVRRRFPNLDSNDTLGLIGRDRRIRRAANEPDENYAIRLRRWLDDHRTRGGGYALLRQLEAHYQDAPFEITLVYFGGKRFTMAVDGPPQTITRSTSFVPGDPWDPGVGAWDGRWWLLYDWPDPLTNDGLWGSGGPAAVWGDGGVWGSSLTPAEIADILVVPSEWNAAHATGRIILSNAGVDVELAVPRSV